MLTLSRGKGERIIIGDPAHPIVIIEVVDIKLGRVRLGVYAEDTCPIHREEVANEILNARQIDDGSK